MLALYGMLTLYKRIGRLTKISDNDNALRSNGIVGYFHVPPVEGFNFTMFSEPLENTEADHRTVSTSPIIMVEDGDDQTIIFHTRYSKYMLEIFPDENIE